MRSRVGLILLQVLFILVVLCNSSFGLQCYNCLDPVSYCNSTTTCTVHLDACTIVVAGPRIYHQCWKAVDCTSEMFSQKLGESELKYRCCQKDLCNHKLKETEEDKEKDEAVTLSGKTTLLVPLVLVTSWNHFL